ncbi:nuclear transport factor 2 family protein [Novosphingobium sp. FKTRR1]|uniref:nuclear transport factor 2 family protein n=1 Tax=Novosphingobium sp. FKTRR1 TaxID=2879118 RepID=UPI001CEFBE4F|nr:nuclear transport factor 2 family protein [Novosphingobium sp. FKTRR1]
MDAVSLAPRVWQSADIADQFALQQLVQAYCHAIDRRDYVLLRSLYHDDAIDDHGAMFCGGPDAYVAWLPAMMANWAATVHSIGNMLFLIDGDSAEGELQTVAYHRTVATPVREIIAGGRYLDRYRKRDGVWRFWRRSLVLDWFEDRALARGEGPSIDDGVEMGEPGAQDAVYSRLPMFAAARAGHFRQ